MQNWQQEYGAPEPNIPWWVSLLAGAVIPIVIVVLVLVWV